MKKELTLGCERRLFVSRAGTRISEYDCLRVIATILVVMGHCVYYRISTDYGGIDYSAFITSKSQVFLICEKLKVLIYLFHMPLFVALSGAVFGLSQKKYATWACLMKNKARRLLIPFIGVTVCYLFPLKYVVGYFDKSSKLFSNLLIGQILMQGNTHLWFLPMLFLIFIIAYLIKRCLNGYSIVKLVLFLFLSMSSSLVSIKIIS